MSENNDSRTPEEMMTDRLATLVNMYLNGATWQLDAETREAIYTRLSIDNIRPANSRHQLIMYGQRDIPCHFNDKVTRIRAEDPEEFELRNEHLIERTIRSVEDFGRKIRALVFIEHFKERDFTYITDEILLNMYAVQIRYPDECSEYLRQHPYFTKDVYEGLYKELPPEMRSSFEFAKDIKQRLDDEAKNRGAQTQDKSESVPQ